MTDLDAIINPIHTFRFRHIVTWGRWSRLLKVAYGA